MAMTFTDSIKCLPLRAQVKAIRRAIRMNRFAAYQTHACNFERDGVSLRFHKASPLEARDTIAWHLNLAGRERRRGDLARARATLTWLHDAHWLHDNLSLTLK